MSRIIATASPHQLLEDVHHHFTDISGLPVIDHEYKCVGVLSKKDVKNSAAGVWLCPALLLLLLPPDVFFFPEFCFPFFSAGFISISSYLACFLFVLVSHEFLNSSASWHEHFITFLLQLPIL
jgi:hypothetical protein